jgi:hypothetical protein
MVTNWAHELTKQNSETTCGASSYCERERERKKETKKRDRGRKVIWAQGLIAARAAEATAGGRDGELDWFLRVVALQFRAGP